jgi:hypothetical protein
MRDTALRCVIELFGAFMRSIDSILLFFFSLPSALRHQLSDWANRTRYSIRFLLHATFIVLAGAFAFPFGQLPNDWPNLVLDNLASVPGAFVGFMLLSFFIIGIAMALLAKKVGSTL